MLLSGRSQSGEGESGESVNIIGDIKLWETLTINCVGMIIYTTICLNTYINNNWLIL
jgi:hypothetical protein